MTLKSRDLRATLTAALAAALMVGAAAPAQAAPPARLFMLKADANGDRMLSRPEVRKLRLERYRQIDLNKNGVLEPNDVALVRDPVAADRLTRFLQAQDADGDGRVTPAEYAVGPMPVFDEADIDGNNFLKGREIERFLALSAPG
ncbi:MAG: hypothetical protein AAF909_00055 [Pseudomonadota bacterium]